MFYNYINDIHIKQFIYFQQQNIKNDFLVRFA